jgi:hypothetical protein
MRWGGWVTHPPASNARIVLRLPLMLAYLDGEKMAGIWWGVDEGVDGADGASKYSKCSK